ncbi:hypothetical protein C8Q73DRAFT_789754 [Cubamyces lactineus]|nr:hypothetical protein C8Q73DRAFT_789754 [Cubamyces lactineus]
MPESFTAPDGNVFEVVYETPLDAFIVVDDDGRQVFASAANTVGLICKVNGLPMFGAADYQNRATHAHTLVSDPPIRWSMPTTLPILAARCERDGTTIKMTFPCQEDLVNFSRCRMLEILKWSTQQDIEPMFLQHEDTGEVIDVEELIRRLEVVWREAVSPVPECEVANEDDVTVVADEEADDTATVVNEDDNVTATLA